MQYQKKITIRLTTIEVKIKFVSVYVSVCLLFVLIACNRHPDTSLPKDDLYCTFKHVKEVINEKSGATTGYQLRPDPILQYERDTLINILKELHWNYKVTTEGELLIQQVSIGDMVGMSYLDGELTRRTSKH